MANTFYTSPTGNDSTGDGSYANPWLTLAQAITGSATGDTIIFKNGTYAFADNRNFSAIRTYQGETKGGVILDNAGATIQVTLGSVIAEADRPMLLKNIIFQNAAQATSEIAMFRSRPASSAGLIEFEDCEFKDMSVKGYDYYGGLFGDYSTAGQKLYLSFKRCFISANRIDGASGGYMFAFRNGGASITSIIFENCTIFTNGSGNTKLDGIFGTSTSGSSYATISFTNTIIRNADTTMPFSYDNTRATWVIANSDFSGVTPLPTLDANSITSDPLFVDEDNGNFNLRPTSPCRRTGVLL